MGGGLPAAAFGGRAEVMSRLAPAGPVYQAGTLSGNPVAVAAGLATLRACTDEVYLRVDAAAATVARLVAEALTKEGVPHRVQTAGSLFSVFFTEDEVRDYDARATQQAWRYPAFFHAMLDRGVYLPPSAYEAWFVSAAHDDAVARPDRRRPARRGPRRRGRHRGGSGVTITTVHLLRHGEVHNPDHVMYGRLPGYHLSARRPADGRAGGEGAAGPGRHLPRVLPAGAGAGDRGAAGDGARPAGAPGRAADGGGELLPGQAVRPRRPGLGAPVGLAAAAQPVPAVLGRAVRAHRRADARRGLVGPGRGRGPRGGLRQPPAADLDAAPAGGGQAALARSRRHRQCGLAR